MASAHYSYIDIAALDAVRERFAAGEAVTILAPALDEVIWANGTGAALFGYSDVASIVGAEPQIGLAARRQITATSGYPKIGKDRAVTVRLASGLTSRAVPFSASEIALPGGEDAILLVAPAPEASWRSPVDNAGRAIAGLHQPGQHAAIVDANGKLAATSPGFDGLGIEAETLTALVGEASGARVVKRMIGGGSASLAAGFLRLTDTPATHLLVVVEGAGSDEAEDPVAVAEEAEASNREPSGTTEESVVVSANADDAQAAMDAAAEAELREDAAEPSTQADEDAGQAEESVSAGADEVPVVAQEVTPAVEEDRAEPIADSLTSTHDAVEPPANEQPAAAEEHQPQPATEALGSDDAETMIALDSGGSDAPAALVAAGSAESEPATVTAQAEEPHASADEAHAEHAEAPTAEAEAPAEAETAPPPIAVDRSAAPVRFVWKTDAAGRFSEIGADLVAAVGAPAADIIGLSFREAAGRLGIDPSGNISGLLERHDTWSGRSVLWPVAGTDLRVPVDLAALPTYDRDRNFAGFRGFGIARAADAVVDPAGTGLTLVKSETGPALAEAPQAGDEAPTPASDASPAEASASTDPFRGEPPILTIVPKQDRRSSDKVIRLAEHRPPALEKGLSPGERNAFREIGDRLKKDSGVTGSAAAGGSARRVDSKRAQADRGAPTPADRGGGDHDTESEEPRPAGELGESQDAGGATATREIAEEATLLEPAVPEVANEEADIADLERLDGKRPTDTGETLETTAAAASAIEDSVQPGELGGETGETEPKLEPTGSADEAALPEPPTTIADDAPVDLAVAEPEAAAAIIVESRQEDAPQAATTAEHPDYLPSAFAPGRSTQERAPIDTSILEKLPIPVLIHSGDRLHYANEEFLDLSGYDSIEEFGDAGGLGVLFGEPYPAEGREAESGRKLRLRTSEGLEYPVEAFLQSVPWGEGKALLLSLRRSWRQPVSYPVAANSQPAAAVAQPAAPQPAAEPDLESRIAEMRAIVDTATDGVVLIAPDGTIRSISSPAEAMFGFDSAEVAGKPFSSLFAIESQRAARDYLNGLSDHGVASVLNDGREVIGREAQGRFIPLFMTIGKLPSDSGYCAVMRDITQWKRAEEELTQARAQAERASSQKTDFLARVSHEIRTPLNAIIGFSELMLDEKFGPVGNDRYRDYLRDINRSGNHVLDLVNDLLDISKIEAGQQEMSYEAVSLNDTLAEQVAMMQPAANRERVIIRSSFASRLPEVVADLRSVRQIALNLLSNAIRYTPAGGQVIVSTAYESTGDVVMRVRDTGIGMSQAEIEQALKPFKQINALKRARGDGTGLGLPLTKAMVEANRARFIINSTPGEGTLVEIAFPSTRVLAE